MHPKWTDNRAGALEGRGHEAMGNDVLSRIFGGSPIGVLVRLVLLSIVVGFILHTLDIDPKDIFHNLAELAAQVWRMGLEPLRHVWSYFLLGAVIVVPIWLLMRLSRGLSGR